MCEIIKENFEERLPEILEGISKCSFVAFDAEFTGLSCVSGDKYKNSLFDDGDGRYKKLLVSTTQGIMSQFGLSLFKHNSSKNQYEVKTYNFFLFPRSFASVDDRFVCQASSLEFLMRYNFDFNKFIYHGISYLNQTQEDELKEALENGSLFEATERNIPFQDEDKIREICRNLAEWVVGKDPGEQIGVDLGLVVPFVVNHEIRSVFPQLWPFCQDRKMFVKVVSKTERQTLESEEKETGDQLEKQLINSLLGFTKVIRHLSESGKPIVGHNCLLDVLKIYNQFIKPLPGKFKDFKKAFNSAFPIVFDTKHLTYDIKKKFADKNEDLCGAFQSSNLSELYGILSQGNKYHPMFSPSVVHAEGFTNYQGNSPIHEAGFDAYLTGFCFIKIAHLAASLDYLQLNQMRPLSFREHLGVLQDHQNLVNIQRAVVNHVNLAGEDPASLRPLWIHVKTRRGCKINPTMVAEKFARYGNADIEPYSRCCAMVAVSSHRGARDILQSFRRDAELIVENYDPIKHNPLLRTCLWAFPVVTAVLGISLLVSLKRS